ncbi:MAG TPA: beta-galactosidase [Candidatus Latescibacteria bacterium]|nr:beta-galactosidase [Candidatus Latescibacterota bacterium]
MKNSDGPIIGAICLNPGNDQAIETLRHIASLSMTMCETILVRGDTAPARVLEIRRFLDEAQKLGVRVLLEPTYEPDLSRHPGMRNIGADGKISTRDNGFCYRNKDYLAELSVFVAEVAQLYGDHPGILRVGGRPVIAIGHEMQYQITPQDGHGGAVRTMTCYCGYCLHGFREWLRSLYGTISAFNRVHSRQVLSFGRVTPPRKPEPDCRLWQEWVDYHATAIPECIALQRQIIERELRGALVTHEINDWYPNTWDCVYTGNHFWRMGEKLEHSFNDQYPMEWAPGSLWRIYLYTFTQDVNQSAMGFERSFWTNGQAFPSWQGDFTEPPDAGYHEQVYSALIHGANGLIWWWGGDYLRRSEAASREYAKLVRIVGNTRPAKDPVAILAPWTTFAQTRSSDRGDDLMGGYQLLIRLGFQVEVVDERQVSEGVLASRGHRALITWGNSCVSPEARKEIEDFATRGGLVLADFGDQNVAPFGTIFPRTISRNPTRARAYVLPDGTTVAVRSGAQALAAGKRVEVIARFDDGRPAIVRQPIGSGVLWRAGSFVGLDYAEGMGVYDWVQQQRVRIEPALENLIAEALERQGLRPIGSTNNRNAEVGIFPVDSRLLVLVANHLRHPLQVTVRVRITGWASAKDVFSGEIAECIQEGDATAFSVRLPEMGGRAFWLMR